MSERFSRFAVAVEALLLALPVTVLAGWAFIAGLMLLVNQSVQTYERAQTIVYALPVVPLLAGWTLIGRFVLRGASALHSSSRLLWLQVLFGAITVLGAFFVGLWRQSISDFGSGESLWPWLRSYFRELMFGLPAIIPLTHLAIERYLRIPSQVHR
jgi:hypothetical protein